MIYDYTNGEPIRQGDIFIGLPRVEISLIEIPVLTEAGESVAMSWNSIVREGNPVTALLAITPVPAIVISQDCDASRAPDITLCEIRPFREVEKKSKDTSAIKKWVPMLTQQARLNQKWFYLPPYELTGFEDRMGVDFNSSLRVPREELELMLHLRKCRLNEVASAHFRERIAEFYRRYPYDEWYPLNHDEMIEYLNNHPDAKPFPWQKA